MKAGASAGICAISRRSARSGAGLWRDAAGAAEREHDQEDSAAGPGWAIGFELRRSLAPLGVVSAAGRNDCDLTYPLQIARLVRREKPDVIVNAAAWTAVERAEEDPVRAMRINAEAVGELAALAARAR